MHTFFLILLLGIAVLATPSLSAKCERSKPEESGYSPSTFPPPVSKPIIPYPRFHKPPPLHKPPVYKHPKVEKPPVYKPPKVEKPPAYKPPVYKPPKVEKPFPEHKPPTIPPPIYKPVPPYGHYPGHPPVENAEYHKPPNKRFPPLTPQIKPSKPQYERRHKPPSPIHPNN